MGVRAMVRNAFLLPSDYREREREREGKCVCVCVTERECKLSFVAVKMNRERKLNEMKKKW